MTDLCTFRSQTLSSVTEVCVFSVEKPRESADCLEYVLKNEQEMVEERKFQRVRNNVQIHDA